MTERRSVPEVYVQWKNVSVCLDFQCECSDPDEKYDMHLDADNLFGGIFRCPRCGVCWQLGAPVVQAVRPGSDDYAFYAERCPVAETDDDVPQYAVRGVLPPGDGTQQPVEPDQIEAMVAELVAGAEAYAASQVVHDGRVACRRCGRRCRTYSLPGDDLMVRLFKHHRLDGDGPCASQGDLY